MIANLNYLIYKKQSLTNNKIKLFIFFVILIPIFNFHINIKFNLLKFLDLHSD